MLCRLYFCMHIPQPALCSNNYQLADIKTPITVGFPIKKKTRTLQKQFPTSGTNMNSEQLPKGATKLGPNCPHDRIDILSCSITVIWIIKDIMFLLHCLVLYGW
jgi:hypothetical protein